jgi:Kef-type K+ transport system membrane component KefB
MHVSFLLVFTSLILIGYLFEIISPKTRVPNIIILLILGMLSQKLVDVMHWEKPDFSSVLPELGTMGLILIVLEGTLELKLTKEKLPLLNQTFLLAFLSIITLCISLGAWFAIQGFALKDSLLNAIPLSIISSAIAIPTAKMLSKKDKEFIIFESSLSDIVGVTLFNFIALNEIINWKTSLLFLGEVGISIIFSLIAALVLTLMISRLKHRVKFMPIIALIVFLYALAKGFHLPALILILVFGLVIANIEKISTIKWFKNFDTSHLTKEIHRFEEITTELTFVVRVSFFLIFGFTIDLNTLLDLDTFILSSLVFGMIVLLRILQLLILKLPIFPLAYVSPRGLITVLLFVSIPAGQTISVVNQTLITQVILMTSAFMMVATIFSKKDKDSNTDKLSIMGIEPSTD